MHYNYVRSKANELNLPHGTKKNKDSNEKKLTTKKPEILRTNGPVIKSVESVLRPEGSLWWERFVEEVGLEAGLK